MIRLEDVTLAPGGEPLLLDVSWHLRPGQRAGLVGRNGTGKTTLLRAIVGERPADEGQVHRRSGARIGWLPQQAVAGSDRSLWEEARRGLSHLLSLEAQLQRAEREVAEGVEGAIERLGQASEAFRIAGGYQIDEKVGEVLHGLGFGPEAWPRPCSTFSGGWQMRIALARVLLAEPDLLILDEPTNHLDLHARTWLARHLARSPCTILLVSHDRHLLDQVCTQIVEIRGRALHTYTGNFSGFLAQREERITQQQQAYEAQQDEIARLERFVTRFKAKATKAAQARSRQNRLDRMERIEAPEHERMPRFHLQPAPPAEAELLALVDATVGWEPDKPVVQDAGLILQRGMRVVMLGPNGAGKSTLLQTLAGRIAPLSGTRRKGKRVKVGIFDQDLAASLPPDLSGLEHVTATAPRITETQARTILGALGLSGSDALRPIEQLSGGEKARVALSAIGAIAHNVLLLDEPTNHLDAVTIEVLVKALAAFDGAMVLITHDRYLAESLATHVWRVHEGTATLREGLLPEDLEPLAASREGARDEDSDRKGSIDYEQRKLLRRERERAERRIAEIEDEIESVEAELHRIDEALFTHAADFERARALGEERDAAEAKQSALMDEWETLGARAEELEGLLA
ncbi:MAG: ABC transporter ATP-binding protein [Deltaproteobacteria bacterium]|nr:MAG: ABC transporter ATP-binding protein [Deltaproteobacteria bacterium]